MKNKLSRELRLTLQSLDKQPILGCSNCSFGRLGFCPVLKETTPEQRKEIRDGLKNNNRSSNAPYYKQLLKCVYSRIFYITSKLDEPKEITID